MCGCRKSERPLQLLSDRPTVQQPFLGMTRSCKLAFQCCGLSPGCIAQWLRRCDSSQQLSSHASANPVFIEHVDESADFDEQASQRGPRLRAELLKA